MRRLSASLAIACLAAAGCGASRTAFATAPGAPTAFDPAGSDAKAVAVADEVLAAVGGAAAWDKAHELVFNMAVLRDGAPVNQAHHAWDRWNGRHQYAFNDAAGNSIVAMYELYGGARTVMVDGQKAGADTTAQVLDAARKAFYRDVYWVFLPFLLKAPGAHLKYVDEMKEKPEDTEMKWDYLQVTFDKGAGPADTYWVYVDKKTHLVDMVELVRAGEPEDKKIGFRLSNWQEVGGLKFPTTWQNIGMPSEQIVFSGIEVHAGTTDEYYVPRVE